MAGFAFTIVIGRNAVIAMPVRPGAMPLGRAAAVRVRTAGHAALMMLERHALCGRHRADALDGHRQRHHDGNEADQTLQHGAIVADASPMRIPRDITGRLQNVTLR